MSAIDCGCLNLDCPALEVDVDDDSGEIVDVVVNTWEARAIPATLTDPGYIVGNECPVCGEDGGDPETAHEDVWDGLVDRLAQKAEAER